MRFVHIGRWTFAWLVFVEALVPCGCERSQATTESKSGAPAQLLKEADLNTILLTPQAAERLGIETAAVERRRVEQSRTLGGDVVVPPGFEITVAAPLAGTIAAPVPEAQEAAAQAAPLTPGRHLAEGETVFLLRPLLSAEARISYGTALVEAAGAVEKASVEVEAARVVLERAEELLRARGGSQRDVDDAKARLSKARAELKASEAQRDVLERVEAEVAAASPVSLAIASPLDGILRNVRARSGQVVAAGTPLFDVLHLARLWLRVPVYAGDLERFDRDKTVRIGSLAGATDASMYVVAEPVAAPPSADPDAATVDLFYEFDNRRGELRPGQKVAIALPLRGAEEDLVVPWSSILHDIHGGTWVYEEKAPRTFVRRRVAVERVVAGDAVLAIGPAVGTLVVTAGAAELFGTEFGIGK